MKSDQMRCIEYGVPYDPSITRAVVYERCGWVCHLCGKRVNKRLRYPSPRSASLDHIVPLSWRENSPGHVWENVALAHLVCNKRKGARYAGGVGRVPLHRPRLSDKTKWKFLYFCFVFLLFVGHASASVLTVAVALGILMVLPKKTRRRRARWRL